MSHDRGPSIVLAELWERTSQAGNVYYSGFWGNLSVALLRDGERPHPTRPDETIVVWRLVAQEREPRPAAPKPAAKPPGREEAAGAPKAPGDGNARPGAPQRRRRPFARETEAARRERVAAEMGGDQDPNDPIPF